MPDWELAKPVEVDLAKVSYKEAWKHGFYIHRFGVGAGAFPVHGYDLEILEKIQEQCNAPIRLFPGANVIQWEPTSEHDTLTRLLRRQS